MASSITRTQIIGLTVSRTVQEWLREGPFSGRVLATFDHACALVIPGNRVVALVTPRIGAGPLNVVVDGSAGVFSSAVAGEPAWLAQYEIHAGAIAVSLLRAAVWEPRPDWVQLRAYLPAITARLPELCTFCAKRAPAESLLALLETPADGEPRSGELRSVARQALGALLAGWSGDPAQLREGAARLAGLGGGLTPSGDDFLTGVMLWAWLTHPAPGDLCRAVTAAAAGRTTTLSAAFLRSASRGECSVTWHALLAALSRGTDTEIAEGAERILAHGATSGADALAGFIWTGLHVPTRACR